ncbi:hypothetical protein Pint_35195 [Pistacia integerrima]|uniref:Uncharacterized protein n=1 Tax=Pistacia integerrima TaxID=434235 RepID=A0ACC0Y2B6_9ROSI|nr:hypothetical protein Pint_35195 [Pistacia integerrima]
MISGLESASIESDKLALLDFKLRITQDPLQLRSSWNNSVHFANGLVLHAVHLIMKEPYY